MPPKTKQQILEILKNSRIKLATVSGILTTKPNLIEWVDQNIPEIDIITTKSYQVKPNHGNREPIIAEIDVGNFANAVGLRNPGMEQGYQELVELKKRYSFRALLNISLSASSIEDFIILVKKFENIANILELNFSCPHAADGFGASIGYDAYVVAQYVKKIRQATSTLIFPKLTPNVENIGPIAKAAIDAGADGIVAINTVGPEIHIEPHTNKPILYNPKGHKGGKSGDWIKKIALEKIREIRTAVGESVPIIGMGGVSTGEDVVKMIEAGADVVGVGSVVARVKQSSLPEFFEALKEDTKIWKNHRKTMPTLPLAPSVGGGVATFSSTADITTYHPPAEGLGEGRTADQFLSKERLAKYKPFKIKKIIKKTDDLKIFELDGKLNFKASQFVFIWIPGVGEKPFAPVKVKPLTFIIRRRQYSVEQNKGLVTNGIFQLKAGDEMMIRGVYGADAPNSAKKNAYIIVGGAVIAIVPKLAKKLHHQGKKIFVYYGITSNEQIVFEKEIKKYAEYISICDNGAAGRVLEVLKNDLANEEINNSCFYNAGPLPLVVKAIATEKGAGVNGKNIFSSIETNNMCGLGICGECECGGRLTCQEGTFFSFEFLEEKGIDIENV